MREKKDKLIEILKGLSDTYLDAVHTARYVNLCNETSYIKVTDYFKIENWIDNDKLADYILENNDDLGNNEIKNFLDT
jgi:hypothetical protein